LGETGKNFGAGMSGGEAYVLDESGDFEDVRLNDDMVHVEPTDERDERLVRRMVKNHYEYTESEKAREVLENWDEYFDKFVKVMPDPYARVVEERMEEGEDIRVSPPPEASAGAATDGGASEVGD
jgi:glutamate synthase (NADPH/NADH) large chain